MLTIPIHAPPVQADDSCMLTKINGDRYSNTHRQSQNYAYNSSKKRMRPIMGASSYQLFGSVFIHLQQDLEQLLLLIGCLGREKFITLKRDISASIILPT